MATRKNTTASTDNAVPAIPVTQTDALAALTVQLSAVAKASGNASNGAASLAVALVNVVSAGNGAPVELVKASGKNPAIELTGDKLRMFYAGKVTGKAATAFLDAIAMQSPVYAKAILSAKQDTAAAKKAKEDVFAAEELRASAAALKASTELMRKQLGRAVAFAAYALEIATPDTVDLSACSAQLGVFYMRRRKSAKDQWRDVAISNDTVAAKRKSVKAAAGTTTKRAPQTVKGSATVTDAETVTLATAIKSIGKNQAATVKPDALAALATSCTRTMRSVREQNLTLDASAQMALVEMIASAQALLNANAPAKDDKPAEQATA